MIFLKSCYKSYPPMNWGIIHKNINNNTVIKMDTFVLYITGQSPVDSEAQREIVDLVSLRVIMLDWERFSLAGGIVGGAGEPWGF